VAQKLNQGYSCITDFPNLPRNTRVKVILITRPLLTTVAQQLCTCERGVFTSRMCVSNITLHRNHLLLFVKHLAMRVLTGKYRIRRQYTDWRQISERRWWCVASRRRWTCAVKPFCLFFLTKRKLICLVIGVTKARARACLGGGGWQRQRIKKVYFLREEYEVCRFIHPILANNCHSFELRIFQVFNTVPLVKCEKL
jgi:hypothetical protein